MATNERMTAEIVLNTKSAQNELKRLEKELKTQKEIQENLIKSRKKGDVELARSMQASIDRLNKSVGEQKKYVHGLSTALDNLSEHSYKDLRNTMNQLEKKLRSGSIRKNSEEWKYLSSKIRECKDEMKKYTEATEHSQNYIQKGADFLNKNWGALTQGIGAVTGLSLAIRSTTNKFAEMDQEMANVRKYTGQVTEEVEKMNEDFKRMDTRTPREELNQLAGAAGRLGITATSDIEEFVDAADKIRVSLGDDLGQEAVDQIGKLAMAFGEDDRMGLRNAMLATGSAVNELAQNSSAQAGYLVDFTARVAGFGKQLGLTQAQIMGFGAVMDENLLRDEMASTAFGNMLTKMQTDTAKFAKIAGMDVEKFTKLLKEDANQAILTLADSLKRQDPQTMMKMLNDMGLDGARAVGVLATLADKVDDVRDRQKIAIEAYEQGNSVIEEFNVQNNTVAAGIDKAKKRFNDLSVELGERLMPIVKYTISTGSLLVKTLSAITMFVFEHKAALTKLAIAITILSALWTKDIILIKARAAETAVATLTDKAATAASILLRSAMLALHASMTLLTKGVKAYTVEMRAARIAGMTNPWTALATVVTVVGVAIYGVTSALIKHREEMRKNTQEYKNAIAIQESRRKLQKQVAEGTIDERDKIDRLSKVIRSNAYTVNERRNAILALQKIIPNYHAAINKEGKLYVYNKQAIKEYIKELENTALAEAIYSRKVEINKKKLDLQMKKTKIRGSLKAVQAERDAHPDAYKSRRVAPAYSRLDGKGVETNQLLIKSNEQEQRHKERLAQVKSEEKALEAEENVLDRTINNNKKLQEYYKKKQIKDLLNNNTAPSTPSSVKQEYVTDEEKKQEEARIKKIEEENRKKQQIQVNAVKAQYKQELSEQIQSYMAGQMTYEEFLKAKHELTLRYYENLKKVYGEDSDEYKKMLDDKVKEEQDYNEKRAQWTEKSMEIEHLDMQRSIRKQYMRQSVVDEESMNEAIFQEDIAYLRKKQELYQSDPKKWAEYEMEITAKQKDHQFQLEQSYITKLKQYREQARLQDYEAMKNLELKSIETIYGALVKSGQMTKQEYDDIVDYIKEKYDDLQEEREEDISEEVRGNASKSLREAKNRAGAYYNGEATDIASGIAGFVVTITQRKKINKELKELYGEDYENNKEYQEAKKQLDAETNDAIVGQSQAAYNTISTFLSAASSYAQACSDLEVAKINANYDKQIAAAGKNTKKKERLEEERDKKIKKAKTAANKKAMKIEIAQAIASTALAAINAYASTVKIPLIGPTLAPIAAGIATAAGLVQVATIKKQHQAEAAGYYKGGFTGGREYRKEAGVVHEGEFVANHEAVNNPNLLPILTLIDQYQRNNKVASLTAADVTNVMGGPAAATVVSPVINVKSDNSELEDVLDSIRDTNNRLAVQLENGIGVDVPIDGENGIYRRLREYENLLKSK